jgi:DNA uptake protein ComE-like DNA-binding protein
MPGEDLDRVKGWWVLAGLVPFGLGAPGGFIYAANRTGRRSWYLAAAVWAIVALVGVVFALVAEDDTPLGTLGGGLVSIAWIGGFVHGLAVRDAYVRMVRGAADDPAREARGRLAQRERAMQLVRGEPEVARELGVGRPDVPGAQHMGVVDVNHGSAEALAQLPGVDADLAQRMIAARDAVQGFASAEDAGAVLDLHPTAVERIGRQAVFLPF